MASVICTTNSEHARPEINKQLRNNSELKASFPQIQRRGSEEISSLVAPL